MTDLPIMFTTPMLRQMDAGLKTETRRFAWGKTKTLVPIPTKWQRLKVGDRLWVQEAWSLIDAGNGLRGGDYCRLVYERDDHKQDFHLTRDEKLPKPSVVGNKMFMPRWASRVTLIVTHNAWVEHLRDITTEAAIREGATSRPNCAGFRLQEDGWSMDWSQVGQPNKKGVILREQDICLATARHAFGNYFAKLHGADSWSNDPEVVPIRFSYHRQNIDALQQEAA